MALTLNALAAQPAQPAQPAQSAQLAQPVFIDSEQLRRRAGEVTLLDAREPWAWRAGHLPGALSAPWTAFTASRRDGQLLPPAQIQARLRRLGVRDDRPVVIYGRWDKAWGEEGRLFWMLEYLGHPQVQVLVGGVEAWPGPLARGLGAAPSRGDFTARPQAERRASPAALQALAAGGGVVLDARTPAEYAGATPHGARRGGHVPGARSLHWKEAFVGGQLRPLPALRQWFEAAGVRFDQPVAAYCTGGIRSGFTYLLLRAVGHPQPQNADGSWWAYAADPALPVARGPAP